MNLFRLILALLFFSTTNAISQQAMPCTGVYKSYQDYITDKKLYPVQTSVNYNISSSKRFLKIYRNDSLFLKLKHGVVYGYCINGESFRYYDSHEIPFIGYFKIIDTSGLIIYSRYENNGHWFQTAYYYSLDSKSRIQKLTFENLKLDFINNPSFIDAVKNQSQWTSKDEDGISNINRIYKQTK